MDYIVENVCEQSMLNRRKTHSKKEFKVIQMPNKVFNTVVDDLNFIGEILSVGITKKGVLKEGADPETVTVTQMKGALINHIVPALYSFVSKNKAIKWKRNIIKKLDQMEGEM